VVVIAYLVSNHFITSFPQKCWRNFFLNRSIFGENVDESLQLTFWGHPVGLPGHVWLITSDDVGPNGITRALRPYMLPGTVVGACLLILFVILLCPLYIRHLYINFILPTGSTLQSIILKYKKIQVKYKNIQ